MGVTTIEWADYTFNHVMGCTKVSPACKNCYAERDFDHRYGKVKWGPSGTRVVTSDANWQKPLKWNSEADKAFALYRCGGGLNKEIYQRPRVFCASLADVFEDWDGDIRDHKGNPLWKCNGTQCFELRTDSIMREHCTKLTMDDVRARLFRLIDATPNLDWLLLTKRPENIRAKWHPFDWQTPSDCPYRKNVWLGTSVESSEYLPRIDSLEDAGVLASVLFISAEPVLGPMPMLGEHLGLIDWVIAGGESGPDARPADPDWFRSIRDQCDMHNVPFHFKQWGEFDEYQKRVGKKAAGRLLDGETHDGSPMLFAF